MTFEDGEIEGSGDITYLYTDFTPNIMVVLDTTYTVTLHFLSGTTPPLTTTFIINSPSISVTNITTLGFTLRFYNMTYLDVDNYGIFLDDASGTLYQHIFGAGIINDDTIINFLYDQFTPKFSPVIDVEVSLTFRNPSNNILATTKFYPASPNAPCFREGTQILCVQDGKETYLLIESLKPGMRVKTLQNGFLPIELIGYTTLQNPGHMDRIQNRLYKCSTTNYPTLSEDLYITGCHSILVDHLTEAQKEATLVQLDRIYITDDKYRLMACIDDRAIPYANENSFKIWHIALENTEYYYNYGIWANGLLVETCSKRYLKELSGMTLVV